MFLLSQKLSKSGLKGLNFMDEDMFMVSVLDEMSDDELEAFCDVLKYDSEHRNVSKGDEELCK